MSTREYLGPAVEFTGGFKNKLLRHRMERTDGSTLLLLDFGVSESNSYPNGALSAGNTFSPLVGPTATVIGTSSTAKLIKSNGKIIAPTSSTGSTIQGINIGTAGAFNLTTENPDFHAMCVFTVPDDVGESGGAYKTIWSLGDTSTNFLRFDTGTNDGRNPRVGVVTVGGLPVLRSITDLIRGVPNIVSVTRVGTAAKLFLNGTQINTWTCPATLPDLSTTQMQVQTSHAGQTVWAVLLERIPAGRTAEKSAADAYDAAVKIGYL